MSTKSFTVNVNSGDVKTSLGSNTGYQQVQIGTGRCFTATLLENWVATADTKNDGTAILWAKGHDVDLTLAKGSNGWRVTNDGNDHGVHFTGSSKNDTLVGGAGMDILDGGAGDDLLAGGKGSDIFCCNGGNDTITDLGRGGDALAVNKSGRVTANLAEDWTADEYSNNDGKATLIANGHSVALSSDNLEVRENVGGTEGWTITNAGNTTGINFLGSLNNDTLIGGTGMDILNGGAGDDRLTGGDGSDIFSCNGGNDTITDLGRGGDALTVNTSGRVTAYLAENWTANQHSNNDGNVTLIAQGHDVTLSEILYGSKGWTITNAGNKTGINFVGSLNNDTLVGGAGDDVLNGGNGNDWLVGGDGADTFEFDTSGWGNDVIVDFHQGTDHLNFIGSTLSAADVKEYHVGLNTVLKYGTSFITLVGVQDVNPTTDIWFNQ